MVPRPLLAPETAASTGDGLRMEPGSGQDTDTPSSRLPWTSITPVGPLPKPGVLRRGSAPQRFLHTTPGGEPHSGMARLGVGWGSTQCPPVYPPRPARGSQRRSLGLLCWPLLQEGGALPSGRLEMGVRRLSVIEWG